MRKLSAGQNVTVADDDWWESQKEKEQKKMFVCEMDTLINFSSWAFILKFDIACGKNVQQLMWEF